ncbi:CDP-glycerol glycerophosphotransferase family protein [Alkalicella caledoniensis]|uniref:CDP-glycerol glycerophosphotransferase family protein n=1 Tax=Alkalicella caledoniensis TaxID=2731377 RepID=A0A7G9W3X0_ALKCA|nr:CDP-glycerol glycerophosphotransferase family protein [Alkalicella caledoniensis]QNO13382.1 CDP-glycerol glycerophosphotransferase family protein [Alkalicella caledoniensis]
MNELRKNQIKHQLIKYPVINTMARKTYKIARIILKKVYLICSLCFLVKPIENKKIIISNYYGKGYGDNAKYICEEILKQGLDYDLVWMLKSDLIGKTEVPNEIRVVKYKSIKALYEMATAKVWIDNSRKEFYPIKRKGQYYIQTWHSPLRLKKIEKDAGLALSSEYVKSAIKDSKNTDLITSGCDFSWNIYRNSFWYDGEILKTGTPRCDLFFQDGKDIKEKVMNYFGLASKSKIILFAPTFRRNNSPETYTLEYKKILKILEEKHGEDWFFLVRLHPNVSSLSESMEYSDKVLNATNYDDMQELLCAIDILITDYSSSMFDMAIAGKPCFLHGKDIEEYLNNEREMYFSFDQLPFDFSKTDEELLYNIRLFNEETYKRKLDKFSKEINLYEDGTASMQLVEKIKTIT